MSLNIMNWGCCNDSSVSGEQVCCLQCNTTFHKECLLASNYQVLNFTSEWKCPECLMKISKSGKNDNTPVRCITYNETNITKRNTKRVALSSPPVNSPPQTCCVTRDDVREIVKDVIRDELRQITSSIKSSILVVLKSELKILNTEMKEIKDSMNFINCQYEDFLKEHESNKEHINELRENNTRMQCTLDQFTSQINSLEQRARSNNLEIQCVPENKRENLLSVVLQLSEVIGSKISKDNISNCTRVAKSNRTSNRPRNIIVQFTSPRIRDEFLASVIKFNKSNHQNKLNTVHLGFEGEKKSIFISEHLSPSNKALHAAARNKAKELGYKYVWVRNGRIFMRKDDHSDFKFINCITTLQNLNT